MFTNIFNKLVISGDILKTLSNMLFVATLVIIAIYTLKSFFNNRRASLTSLLCIIAVDILLGFAFFYNNVNNLFGQNFEMFTHSLIIVAFALVSVFVLIKHLFKKPIENGSITSSTRDANGELVVISGDAYVKAFKKRKVKDFFYILIRNGVAVISLFFVDFFKNLFADGYNWLKDLSIQGKFLAEISVYTILFVAAFIVIAIVSLIFNKIDEL